MNAARILIALCLMLLAQASAFAQGTTTTTREAQPILHKNPLGRIEVPDTKEQRLFIQEHSLDNPSHNRNLTEGKGAEDSPAMQGSKQVRVIYLVPSDRTVSPDYQKAIASAISSLQIFYRNQLGGELAFSLHSPSVEIYQTSRPASFYSTGVNARAGGFWESVMAEGFALTKSGFNDPNNRWIFFIDADPACGQYTGGVAGAALLPANDLRGLTNRASVPACPGDPSGVAGVNRWVGGLGHELGHAFNLPHPSGCDSGNCTGGQFAYNSLMYIGYLYYPSTYFIDENRTTLLAGGFFNVLTLDPAAQYEINGRVTRSDQTPVAGATIRLNETQASAVSDANGNFTFTALTSGDNYLISVSKAGYSFTSPNVLFNNLDRIQSVNFVGSLTNNAPPPVLLTEENTSIALAFDSVTQTRGPFALTNPANFSSDARTRISLLVWQLELLPGEDISAVKVQAVSEGGATHELAVESLRVVPGFEWLTQVVVKLPAEITAPTDLRVSVNLRGATSNQGIIRIVAP